MARAIVKLGIAAAVVAAMSGVLITTTRAARLRGKTSECRNNLHKIASLAVQVWNWEHPTSTKINSETVGRCHGREFWQFVREMKYKKITDAWLPYPDPDPFVCPVKGTTVSDKTDAKAIDYRGPRQVRYDEEKDLPLMPADQEMIGADLEGNHPWGGHVMFRDFSVKDVTIRPASPHDHLWSRAASELSE